MLGLVLSVAGCIDAFKEPPKAAVTSHNIRSDGEGLDYYTYVDVSVHNFGVDGTAVVWVTVTQGENKWVEMQSVFLASQESIDLTFTFTEPGFLSPDPIYSQVRIDNLRV